MKPPQESLSLLEIVERMRIGRAIAPGDPGAEVADGFGEKGLGVVELQIKACTGCGWTGSEDAFPTKACRDGVRLTRGNAAGSRMKTKRRPLTRSENMSRIRSKDTGPEMVIRRGLHARGFRFRLHRRDLPGTPDLVLRRFGAVIEVRGCYWHAHPGCGRAPSTNQEYWGPKLRRNRERDVKNEAALQEAGWRVCVVWECTMIGKGRWDRQELLDAVEEWLLSGERFTQMEGQPSPPAQS